MEPHVDALEVEPVAALGQQPGLLAVDQLAEADRALESLLEVRRPIDGDGQRAEHGRVEATARCGVDVSRGEYEAGPGATPEGGVRTEVAPGIEVEEEDENDDHEEEDGRRHHHLAVYPDDVYATGAAADILITWLCHR